MTTAARAGFVAVAASGLAVLALGVLSTSERARRTAGVVDDEA